MWGNFIGCNREWILGFARNLGSSSVLVAAVGGILSATEIGWNKDFHKLWVEADSKLAVQMESPKITHYVV